MILLSFDIEEFDAPLEHGVELPFEEQMRTSVEGTRKILACLGPSPGKRRLSFAQGELRPSRKGFDLGHPKGWT